MLTGSSSQDVNQTLAHASKLGITKPIKVHQTSRHTNFNFEIIKKALDLVKDSIRAKTYWLNHLEKYFPILAVCIWTIAFSLQLAIIISDKKNPRSVKIAAGILFGFCFAFAGLAVAFAVTQPIISNVFGILISSFFTISDSIQFYLGLKRLKHNKKRLSQLNEEGYEQAHNKSLIEENIRYKRLYCTLQKHLYLLTQFSCDGNSQQFNKELLDTQQCLNLLVDSHLKCQAIKTEPKTIEREMQQQTELLTFAAISLVINVLAISLAIASVATFGAAPLSLSIILLLVFVVDGAELVKNIHVRNRNNAFRKENAINHTYEAKKLVNQAHGALMQDAEKGHSYRRMIGAMPKKPVSGEAPSPTKEGDTLPLPKDEEEALLRPLQATQLVNQEALALDEPKQKAEQNMRNKLELGQSDPSQVSPTV